MYPTGRRDRSTSVKINFLSVWELSTISWKGFYGMEMVLASMHCCHSLFSTGISAEATEGKRCLQSVLLNKFQFKPLVLVACVSF